MSEPHRIVLTIQATVFAPIEKVWKYWTEPAHITQWNHASDDWHSPWAENDLRVGGKFISRMEARDGSFGFDFEGVYEKLEPLAEIAYVMADGRTVRTLFEDQEGSTLVTTHFGAEEANPIEMQRDGWQAILNNFKKYTEA